MQSLACKRVILTRDPLSGKDKLVRKLPFPVRSPGALAAKETNCCRQRQRRSLESDEFGLSQRGFFGQELNEFRQIRPHFAPFIFNQPALS